MHGLQNKGKKMESKSKGEKTYQAITDKDALYGQAKETLPAYERAMEDFLDELKAADPEKFETVRFEMGPLKSIDRFQEKVTENTDNAAKVRDLVRGTFVADSTDELMHIQDALEQKFKPVLVKDNVFDPTDTGLRNYNNNIRMPNGHIVEVQVMPSELWDIKGYSHNLMEESQSIKRLDNPTPEQKIIKESLDKENRIAQNSAVYDTDANTKLNPAYDEAQKARFNIPFDVSKQFEYTQNPYARAFNKSSGFALKIGGRFMSVLPIVGTVIGVGMNTAEAAELQTTLQDAIDQGAISEDALLEYNAILAGHIAQGGDPSVVLGEAGVQVAFNEWADRHNVQGDLREDLQPTSLALMARSGAYYLSDATMDVTGFALNQSAESINSGVEQLTGAIDYTVDAITGDLAQRQSIYDGLPVLNKETENTGPIHENIAAHNLAQIKTQIVWTEEKLSAIETDKENPIAPLNKNESIIFLQERIANLNNSFEETYDSAKQDGTLDDIIEISSQQTPQDTDSNNEALSIQKYDTGISTNNFVGMTTR